MWIIEIWRRTRIVVEIFDTETAALAYARQWLHTGHSIDVKLIAPNREEKWVN